MIIMNAILIKLMMFCVLWHIGVHQGDDTSYDNDKWPKNRVPAVRGWRVH